MSTRRKGDGNTDDESDGVAAQYASPPCYQHEIDPMYEGNAADVVDAKNWADVNAWRKRNRTRLAAQRQSLGDEERHRAGTSIIRAIRTEFLPSRQSIAIYWPVQGEIDLRSLAESLVADGGHAGLPVIVGKNQPLEFWRWTPQTKMTTSGLWGIPAPAERNVITPAIVFVPLLGFDKECHRLGYGGGYYDRTLAVLPRDTVTIGVGYDFGRLPTTYPQAHDVSLDAIVTESGVLRNPLRVGSAT